MGRKNLRSSTSRSGTKKGRPSYEDSSTFDFVRYGSDVSSHKTWVDIIYSAIKLPYFLPSALLALTVFAIGYFIAWSIGFQKAYAASLPIHLGVIGIFWVTLKIRSGNRAFHDAYEHLRPCFLISDEDYVKLINKWFARFADNKANLAVSTGFVGFALVIVYISFFQKDLLTMLGITSFRPASMQGVGWFANHGLLAKSLIVAFFGLAVGPPLGTATRLLVLNLFFQIELHKLPVVPLASIVRFRLEKITNMYISISSAWFIGVALFAVMLYDSLDGYATLGLAILSLVGISTFMTPQLIYRKLLQRSNSLSNQWVLAAFYNRLGINLREKDDIKYKLFSKKRGLSTSKMADLSGFMEASVQSSYWVYDPWDVAQFFIAQGLAVIGYVISRIPPR